MNLNKLDGNDYFVVIALEIISVAFSAASS